MEKYFSILIMDDEPAIRNGIADIIREELEQKTIIYQASDGKFGLEQALKIKPSLIISDIVMPEMTGLEVKRELKKQGIDIPTIMVSGFDEFKYAKEAISLGVLDYILKPISKKELLNSIKRINLKISNQQRDETDILKAAKDHFIHQLLRGEIKSEEEAEHGMQNLSIKMNSQILSVATVIAPENVLKNIEKQEDIRYATRMNNNLIIIFQSNETYALHQLKLILNDEKDFLAGLGNSVSGFSKLNQAYQYSLQALSYSIYYPDESILYSKHITNGESQLSPANLDTTILKNYIIECDEPKIENWVEEFYSSLILGQTPPPPSFIKGMSIFVLSDLQKYLINNLSIPSKAFSQINTSVLSTIYRLEELKTWLLNNLMEISKKVIPNARLSNMSDIHMARKYVDNNINKIISCNEIADKLNMTPSYFSTYFKKKTGEGFTSYIQRVKDEKAKNMLSMPDYSIEEISRNLGYSDYRSFHRAFKKINGISPSSYRNMIIQNKK